MKYRPIYTEDKTERTSTARNPLVNCRVCGGVYGHAYGCPNRPERAPSLPYPGRPHRCNCEDCPHRTTPERRESGR